MTFYASIAAAGLILAAMGAAGCSQEPSADKAAAVRTAAENPDIHAFRIGTLDAVALKDGTLTLPADDAGQSPWSNTAEVTALLASVGQPDGQIHMSIQPLLIRDGDRLVLIDTGAGGQMGADARLMASLRAAGVEARQVTDVLISHTHDDHVGGLVGADGALAFPNAVIRMSTAEWADFRVQAERTELIRAITPKIQTFEPGAVVAPGITVVNLPGHTPGHVGYEIVSGTDRVLYIGDAMHSPVISVQRPEWVNGWDSDSAAAVITRQGLLERGARPGARLYAGHFPFPGLGRFQRRDDGFVWIPETPAQP